MNIAFTLGFPVLILLSLMLWLHWHRGIARAVTSTSPLGAAIPVEGLLLQVANNTSSPLAFFTIANVSEFTLPLGAKTVDVTNVGNAWEAMIPTLNTYGKITLKIFWVMRETTHENAPGQSTPSAVATGLRYLYVTRNPPLLRQFNFIYPDGLGSADSFMAYVTGFNITGKVAGVFEATIELTANDQNPTFV